MFIIILLSFHIGIASILIICLYFLFVHPSGNDQHDINGLSHVGYVSGFGLEKVCRSSGIEGFAEQSLFFRLAYPGLFIGLSSLPDQAAPVASLSC